MKPSERWHDEDEVRDRAAESLAPYCECCRSCGQPVPCWGLTQGAACDGVCDCDVLAEDDWW